ncbi:MAG: hypothetical protein QOF44_1137, partial [Streptomyces sp.]|nr:hypothetical protein [Streptomyces sp.]
MRKKPAFGTVAAATALLAAGLQSYSASAAPTPLATSIANSQV